MGKASLNKTILKAELMKWLESITIVLNNKEHICLSWFRREQRAYTLRSRGQR